MASIVDDFQLLNLLIGHQDNTLEILTLNADKESHDRIQLVLVDYFTKQNAKLSTTDIESDAELIKKIFPDCSLNDVKHSLQEIGDEQNRVKIVLKKLTNNTNTKRPFEYCANTIINSKKLKTSSQTLEERVEKHFVNKLAEDFLSQAPKPACFDVINEVESSTSSSNVNTGDVLQETPKSISTNGTNSTKPSTSTSNYGNLHSYPTDDGSNQEEMSSTLKSLLSNLDYNSPVNASASNTSNFSFKTNANQDDLLFDNAEASSSVSSNVDPILNIENCCDFGKSMEPSTSSCARTDLVLDSVQNKSVFENPAKPSTLTCNNDNSLTENNLFFGSSHVKSSTFSTETNPERNYEQDFIYQIVNDLVEESSSPQSSNSSNDNSDSIGNCLQNDNVSETVRVKPCHLHNRQIEEVILSSTESSSDISSSTADPLSNFTFLDESNKNKDIDKSEAQMLEAAAPIVVTSTSSLVHSTSSSNQEPRVPPIKIILKASRLNLAHTKEVPKKIILKPSRLNLPVYDGILNQRLLTLSDSGQTEQKINQAIESVLSCSPAKKRMDSASASCSSTSTLSENPEVPPKKRKLQEENLGTVSPDLQIISPVEQATGKLDENLFYRIMEMFPDICPSYLRRICTGKKFSEIDNLISLILEAEDYPKRTKPEVAEDKLNFEEQLELMKQVLPEAAPDFLEMQCVQLIDKPDQLKEFMSQAIENHDYPSMKEYLRKQKILTQQKQYTTEFNVTKFLEIIPDPAAHFKGLNQKSLPKNAEADHYAICYLRNRYRQIQLATIRESYRKHNSILQVCNELDKDNSRVKLKCKRPIVPMPSTLTQYIPLLQEIAYSDHYDEITKYIQGQKLQKLEERKQFKENGLMKTCQCCFDDEVIPPEIYSCESGCEFCKNCVKQSAEITFGDGKLDFKCLADCGACFSLQTLQHVLSPKLFSQIASQKQLEEIKSAGIENLEMCPFCNFAAIPAKDDRLFQCFNPACMKETCRLCKEPSHIPLRCEEVEKEADVQVRTFIENKMTEALLRTCWKCGMKFIKSDGCNKMTCSCGAKMCYICNKPVTDYKHFNGPGGDRYSLCPLYSDTHQLHETAVLSGALQAKQEIASKNPTGGLKLDPTSDVKQHYNDLRKTNPLMRVPGVVPAVGGAVGHVGVVGAMGGLGGAVGGVGGAVGGVGGAVGGLDVAAANHLEVEMARFGQIMRRVINQRRRVIRADRRGRRNGRRENPDLH